MNDTPEGLVGGLEYRRDLFDATTVERLGRSFRHLLVMLLDAPGQPLATVSPLTVSQRHQVLVEWTASGPAAALDTLPALFAAQVDRRAERVAIIREGTAWSYAALDARAERLAHRLRAVGVGPENTVGICLERGPEMVAAMLGVLKSGAAYVPLDPTYPSERLAFLLADSGAPVTVTHSSLDGVLPHDTGERIFVDHDRAAPVTAAPATARPEQLAYLIYTSGSTGRPKGVAITHRSATALVSWAREAFPAEAFSGMLAATSINFDLSVFEVFVPLALGGTVIVAKDVLELPSLEDRDRVRLVNTVPSAVAELARDAALPPNVRWVTLAGEVLQRALVARLESLPQVGEVWNLYGPSEDTTYSTGTAVPRMDLEPTIGRPLPGTHGDVLGEDLEPVVIGGVGELYLGGAGLARGYFARPALTAERFVPGPRGGAPGARLYRTGDLTRFRADGELLFLGRRDHQVKLRGFRVELGEIEAALGEHPAVAQAVVDAPAMPESPGDRRLLAWVTATGDAPRPDVADLQADLRLRLPEHMVPAHVVVMDELPRLPNGKIDRAALGREAVPSRSARAAYVAPRTPLEQLLARIWREVLDVEGSADRQIGVNDDFFELGGHSLLATRVISRVRASLGTELPLKALFETPTVAGLARRVTETGGRQGVAEAPIEPVDRQGRQALPVSFAQERLWLLDRMNPGDATYNMPAAVRLRGRLDVAALATALGAVVERHETLRTTFRTVDGEPVQIVAPPGAPASECRLPVIDLGATATREAAAHEAMLRRLAHDEAQRPFDLGRGPLLRTTLLALGESLHVVLVTFHHIISDGWSIGVFVHEVAALYRATVGGHPRRCRRCRFSMPTMPTGSVAGSRPASSNASWTTGASSWRVRRR